MLNHTKRKLTATGIMCLMLTAASTTAYGAASALQTAAVSTQAVQNSVEDPTLGGLFELYTPAEYEETINQITWVLIMRMSKPWKQSWPN